MRRIITVALVTLIVVVSAHGVWSLTRASTYSQRLILLEFYRLREKGLDYEDMAHSLLGGQAAQKLAETRISLVASRTGHHATYRIVCLQNRMFTTEVVALYVDELGGIGMVSTYRETGRLDKVNGSWRVVELNEPHDTRLIYNVRFDKGSVEK